MRRAAKVDRNHPEIVRMLREIGCGVLSLARVGEGCPDLLVHAPMWPHVTLLLEIKDGSLRPSERKLKPSQVKFHAEWKGPVYVVTTPEEAFMAVRFAHERRKFVAPVSAEALKAMGVQNVD